MGLCLRVGDTKPVVGITIEKSNVLVVTPCHDNAMYINHLFWIVSLNGEAVLSQLPDSIMKSAWTNLVDLKY